MVPVAWPLRLCLLNNQNTDQYIIVDYLGVPICIIPEHAKETIEKNLKYIGYIFTKDVEAHKNGRNMSASVIVEFDTAPTNYELDMLPSDYIDHFIAEDDYNKAEEYRLKKELGNSYWEEQEEEEAYWKEFDREFDREFSKELYGAGDIDSDKSTTAAAIGGVIGYYTGTHIL